MTNLAPLSIRRSKITGIVHEPFTISFQLEKQAERGRTRILARCRERILARDNVEVWAICLPISSRKLTDKLCPYSTDPDYYVDLLTGRCIWSFGMKISMECFLFGISGVWARSQDGRKRTDKTPEAPLVLYGGFLFPPREEHPEICDLIRYLPIGSCMGDL